MTPTAQLADYVLPGDSWLERPWLTDSFGWMSSYRASQQSMDPPGEAISTFEFWKKLAGALDRPEIVPWRDLEAFYDDRLKDTGMSFREFADSTEMYFAKPEFRKYLRTGFATPSGKVELASSVLDNLGFDPLPYFREDPPGDADYPLQMFTGVREDGYFQTAQRQVPEMRRRSPEPVLFVSPGTAQANNLQPDEWVEVENPLGKISIKVGIRDAMPDGLVRIPHGWWKPEMKTGAGHLSGALKYSDAQLCRDGEDYLDREQGIPHLKGIPCRIIRLAQAPQLEVEAAETIAEETIAEETIEA